MVLGVWRMDRSKDNPRERLRGQSYWGLPCEPRSICANRRNVVAFYIDRGSDPDPGTSGDRAPAGSPR